MTALEIVLVSLISVIAVGVLVAKIAKLYLKGFVIEKHKDFVYFDKHRKTGEIVFLGDSLTDFYPLHEYFPDLDIVNRGVASDTTMHVERRIEEVIHLKPRAMFLQIGVNDLLTNRKVSAEEVKNRIFHIADKFSYLGKKLFIISLYPVNRKKTIMSGVVCRNANNKRIQQVNTLLKDETESRGYTYVDLHDYLSDGVNLNPHYTVEGLHINAFGYDILSEKLAPYLENL